jgi:hypothetical protein
MNNRLQTILETLSNILNENKETRQRRQSRAARGDEEAAIADVVLRGFTSPEVEKAAERLETKGLRRMEWEEKGSRIRNKAAELIRARRKRLGQGK